MFIRHNDKKGQKPKRDWTGYINLGVIKCLVDLKPWI